MAYKNISKTDFFVSLMQTKLASLICIKKKPRSLHLDFWCGREDLNPHGLPLDPKSSASASSATSAYMNGTLPYHITIELTNPKKVHKMKHGGFEPPTT